MVVGSVCAQCAERKIGRVIWDSRIAYIKEFKHKNFINLYTENFRKKYPEILEKSTRKFLKKYSEMLENSTGIFGKTLGIFKKKYTEFLKQ